MALTERLMILMSIRGAEDVAKGMTKVGKAAEREIGKSNEETAKLGAQLTKVGAAMVGTGALIAYGLAKAGQAASDLESSTVAMSSSFGEATDKVAAFAKSADAIGISERAVNQAGSRIGSTLISLGYDSDDAADSFIELTKRAADMAVGIGTTDEAINAISSALRGELDPIERFGVKLKQSDVEARAMALGLDRSTTAAKNQANAIATVDIIMGVTASKMGNFGSEANRAARAQQQLSARWEEAQASLGQAVLPTMSRLLELVGGLLQGFADLDPATQRLIGWFTILSGGGLLLVGALASIVGNLLTLKVAMAEAIVSAGGLKAALAGVAATAGPILLAAAAVGVLAKAWFDHNETVRQSKVATKDYTNAILDMMEGIEEADAALGHLTSDALSKFNTELRVAGQSADDYVQSVQTMDDELEYLDDNLRLIERGVKSLAEVLDDPRFEGTRIKELLLAYEEANGKKAVTDLIDELDRQADAFSRGEQAAAKATDRLDGFERSVGRARNAVLGTSDGADDLTDGLDELDDGLTDTERSIKAVNEALDSLVQSFRQGADAEADQLSAFLDAEEAAMDLAKAELDLAELRKDKKATATDIRKAEMEVTRAQLDQADSARSLLDSTAALVTSMRESNATQGEMQAQVDLSKLALRQMADQGIITEAQFDELSAAMGRIPVAVRTQFIVDVERSKFDAIVRDIQREVQARGYGHLDAHLIPDFSNYNRASGGPIPGPRGKAVPGIAHGGEFVLSADVVDAIKRGGPTRGLGGAGGGAMANASGGVTIIVNSHSLDPTQAGQSVVDALTAHVRRNGPLPGAMVGG